jgi:hypothetical protein
MAQDAPTPSSLQEQALRKHSHRLCLGSGNNLPTILFRPSSLLAAWVRFGCSFFPETLTTGLEITGFSFLVRPAPGWIKHEENTLPTMQSPARLKLHCIPLSRHPRRRPTSDSSHPRPNRTLEAPADFAPGDVVEKILLMVISPTLCNPGVKQQTPLPPSAVA